jgi:hypothetical protein
MLQYGVNNNFARWQSKIYPVAQTEYGRAADFMEHPGADDFEIADPVTYAQWIKPYEDVAANQQANQSAYTSTVLGEHSKHVAAYRDTRVKLFGYIISKLTFSAYDKVK